MRIMIVDDHPGFRQVVKKLLQAAGTEFLECGDGHEAFRQYALFHPDIVLMDVAMKELDGLRATKRIVGVYPGARILMLTQYDDPELRSAAERAGAVGYFPQG